VVLPHLCTQYERMNRGDSRNVVVRYRFDHSSFVNSQLMPVRDDLRREIFGLMSTRQEQVLSFGADERLSYGEVSGILLDLEKDDPKLYIVLLTKKQVDPLDEGWWRRASDLCMPKIY
jgi:hypothetical protein